MWRTLITRHTSVRVAAGEVMPRHRASCSAAASWHSADSQASSVPAAHDSTSLRPAPVQSSLHSTFEWGWPSPSGWLAPLHVASHMSSEQVSWVALSPSCELRSCLSVRHTALLTNSQSTSHHSDSFLQKLSYKVIVLNQLQQHPWTTSKLRAAHKRLNNKIMSLYNKTSNYILHILCFFFHSNSIQRPPGVTCQSFFIITL